MFQFHLFPLNFCLPSEACFHAFQIQLLCDFTRLPQSIWGLGGTKPSTETRSPIFDLRFRYFRAQGRFFSVFKSESLCINFSEIPDRASLMHCRNPKESHVIFP